MSSLPLSPELKRKMLAAIKQRQTMKVEGGVATGPKTGDKIRVGGPSTTDKGIYSNMDGEPAIRARIRAGYARKK